MDVVDFFHNRDVTKNVGVDCKYMYIYITKYISYTIYNYTYIYI